MSEEVNLPLQILKINAYKGLIWMYSALLSTHFTAEEPR